MGPGGPTPCRLTCTGYTYCTSSDPFTMHSTTSELADICMHGYNAIGPAEPHGSPPQSNYMQSASDVCVYGTDHAPKNVVSKKAKTAVFSARFATVAPNELP